MNMLTPRSAGLNRLVADARLSLRRSKVAWNELTAVGLSVYVSPTVMVCEGRSLKGQLGHAGALGARFVAIVGQGHTILKDMQGGGQETIATGAVVHAVLRDRKS